MRALLLTALLTPLAAAQVAPAPPPADGDRCDAPAAMPEPFELAEDAAAVDVAFEGPTPVPMPNLCGETAALAAPAAPLRPPAALYDGDGPLPEAYRRRVPPQPLPPGLYREYRDLLERLPGADVPPAPHRD